MKLFYINDWDTGNAVIDIGDFSARIYRTGIKPYSKQFYAQKYLQSIMEEKVKLPVEPDEIFRMEQDETKEDFEDRMVGDVEHIACFERIFPKKPSEALNIPVTFHKCFNVFPPSDIWYKTEKEAKKDADGIDTVYVGPVEVYDPKEIERIEAEIASYNE